MHLVLTGASGFIGRNVLRRAPGDWRITAVTRRAPEMAEFVRTLGLANVRVVGCDLLVADQVRAAAASAGRADAALYLAGNGDPACSVIDPSFDLRANCGAIVSFLEHWPVEHLVYVSSGAVYDGLSGPVMPDSRVSPSLPYGITKLASEQFVDFFVKRRGSPRSSVTVRFFGAYGPYEPDRKITTRWLKAIMKGQREFTVRGDGQNLIDFMYVNDAVDGFLTLLQAAGQRATLDFASGSPVPIDDIIHAMARACGVEVHLRHEGVTDEYITFRTVDRTMQERFGVVASTPFEEGFRQLQSFIACEQSGRATMPFS